MKYVVGYSPTQRGQDALNLAVVMARSLGAELEVVYVLKTPTRASQHHAVTSPIYCRIRQWVG